MTNQDEKKELEKLRKENELLRETQDLFAKEIAQLRKRLLNASGPRPIERVSMRRLVEAARQACLDVKRQGRKILVTLGYLHRAFKNRSRSLGILITGRVVTRRLVPSYSCKSRQTETSVYTVQGRSPGDNLSSAAGYP